ncbi:pentatricopeptide repeat-containing protein At3g03580 [Apium graveolens]|uniref:pentatricopeptide repeat-containing protein At3g03580 n=1 Tax=Apium graveolens TaxID=4045 RepID=UPI003D7919D8
MTSSNLQFQVLKALSSSSTLNQLQKIHTLLIVSGLDQINFFSGKLMSKYAHFKHPFASLSIFRHISPTQNVYLYNTIIRAMTHNALFSHAFTFYFQMFSMKVHPDRYTFPSLINACAGFLNVSMGNIVHHHVLLMGFHSDLYVANALIDMYARFNQLPKARYVFDSMPHRDIVSWNSIISGYSSNGYWEEALNLFKDLRKFGQVHDFATVSSVLPACGGLVAFVDGELVHGLVDKTGMRDDTVLSNGLLSMYFKFDNLEYCRKLFDETVAKDTITWNIVICGYSQSGLYEESIELFQDMVSKFEPDLLTITSVLRACTHIGELNYAKLVHKYMTRKGYTCDTTASNILISMYSKCSDMVTAREIFDRIKYPDLVSWNSLINGYFRNGCFAESVNMFKMLKVVLGPDFVTYLTLLSMSTQLVNLSQVKQIHSDLIKVGYDSCLVVGNALVDAYAKCGSTKDSLIQFDSMKCRDIVTWNSIIAACVHFDECDIGFKMINQMRRDGVTPDEATMLGLLPICSVLLAKRQGKEIHACILRLGYHLHVPIGNALIEMYSKCGSLKNSVMIFEHMKTKDVVTWTSLISAYGIYGEGRKAISAFEEMKRTVISPDHIIFVSVIHACSHSGLVEEGQAYFNRMKKDYNIEPRFEHYASVVDLLSRSGLLAEAEEFIFSMPFKPDESIWGSLLSACRSSSDVKIAERVAERIVELNSENTGYHILVSNVYATLGKWDKVRTLRKSLKHKGLKKDPGCSWLQIHNKVYVFGAGDRHLEQYEEVNKFLELLDALLRKEGYVADLKFVLHDVDDDEKRDMLCSHSERIAIAFGLLNTKPGTPLQIMKNLRVCGDCHTFTKYISKIVQRELLVRDANRFHLFKDGVCSCKDLW